MPSTGNVTQRSTCQCKAGWGGVSCDACADGFWGAECQGASFPVLRRLLLMIACTGDCTRCDDGLHGSGTCLGTTTDSVRGVSTSGNELMQRL